MKRYIRFLKFPDQSKVSRQANTPRNEKGGKKKYFSHILYCGKASQRNTHHGAPRITESLPHDVRNFIPYVVLAMSDWRMFEDSLLCSIS